jgi:hypothetical protein
VLALGVIEVVGLITRDAFIVDGLMKVYQMASLATQVKAQVAVDGYLAKKGMLGLANDTFLMYNTINMMIHSSIPQMTNIGQDDYDTEDIDSAEVRHIIAYDLAYSDSAYYHCYDKDFDYESPVQ